MSGLNGPLGAPDPDEEVDSEIRFHIERRIEALMREGRSRAEAEREALRRFGDVEGVRMGMRREVRLRRGADSIRGALDGARLDLRYAFRQWRRNPGFTALVMATLALGIGAATAVFSVVDHVLLRPLPFPDPDRLAVLWSDVRERGGPQDEWLSYANFRDAVDMSPGIEAGALWGGFSPTLTGRGNSQAIAGGVVTQGMFSRILGVDPVLGRGFAPEEDVPGAPNVVMLSHAFWTEVLAGEADVLGSTLVLNDVSYEVIGVMPEGFRPPFRPDDALWILPRVDPVAAADGRGGFSWRSVVRLSPGVELEGVQTQLDGIAERLQTEYADSNTGLGFSLVGLQDDMVAPTRFGLWVVLASVLLLLVVACVNVANLVLSRATERLGELSVRSAMGADRRRIIRQLIVESVGLSALGGALGVALGVLGTRALVALAPDGTPRIEAVSVDLRILAVSLVATVGAGVLFGLVPALLVSGKSVRGHLGEVGRGGLGTRASLRVRNALVAAQVALALVVLVGAGLLGRTFQNLRSVDLGFDAEPALTFFVNLPQARYPDGDAIRPMLRDLEERLGAIPGVASVGTVSSLPLSGFDGDADFNVDGRPPRGPGERVAAWIRRVTPGYPEALGLRLVNGRFLDERDASDGALVALINETLAERHFVGENPIGRFLDFGEPGGNTWEIVGVVEDIRHFSVRDDRREAVYMAFDQVPVASAFLVVRAAEGRDPTLLASEARRVVAELDPALAPQQMRAMNDVVAAALAPDRFLAILLSAFAGVTLVLAVVGLYGVMAVAVAARRRELGVRMALGAEGSSIRGLVVRRALQLAGVGLVLGLAMAIPGASVLQSMLFGVESGDPVTFFTVATLLLLVAVAAAAIPAWRAGRSDPASILRSE